MSCLLPLIAGICIADPHTLTLSGQALTVIGGDVQYTVKGMRVNDPIIGRATIQLSFNALDSLRISYGLEHESLLSTDEDRGEEYAFIKFEWRPFGRF